MTQFNNLSCDLDLTNDLNFTIDFHFFFWGGGVVEDVVYDIICQTSLIIPSRYLCIVSSQYAGADDSTFSITVIDIYTI